MSEEPGEEKQSGRLRAEDRRGVSQETLLSDHFPLGRETPDPEEEWKVERPGGWRWQLMKALTAVLFVVLAFVIAFFWFQKKDTPLGGGRGEPLPALNFMERADAEEVARVTEEVVRGFMDAADAGEASHYILDGERRIEQLRDYAQRPGGAMPEGFGKILKTMPLAFDGFPMQSVIASEADGKNGWLFVIAPTRDGLLIDWEATVAYGDMSWTEFIEKRPTTPTLMRVYLIREHHSPGLPNEDTHDFYRVEARKEKWSVPAFAISDSPLGAQIRECVPPNGSQPVTLRLTWNESKEVVEIVELVHNFWVDLADYHQRLTTQQDR